MAGSISPIPQNYENMATSSYDAFTASLEPQYLDYVDRMLDEMSVMDPDLSVLPETANAPEREASVPTHQRRSSSLLRELDIIAPPLAEDHIFETLKTDEMLTSLPQASNEIIPPVSQYDHGQQHENHGIVAGNEASQSRFSLPQDMLAQTYTTDVMHVEPSYLHPDFRSGNALPVSDFSFNWGLPTPSQQSVMPNHSYLSEVQSTFHNPPVLPRELASTMSNTTLSNFSPLHGFDTFDVNQLHQRALRTTQYPPERPCKDDGRDWVRVNGTTAGKSTRSGKINKYDARLMYPERLPAPAPWSSSATGNIFNYTAEGELTDIVQPAERIADFIYNHPKNGTSEQMILWIQKCPADSARRYPTRGSSKCRFKECAAACFGRTIGVGHYRVAFDESWALHGRRRDPFIVSAYVHLYCLERFLDLRDVAARFDVRPDNRDFATEPRGVWAPSLGLDHDQEYVTASVFCKSARRSDGKFELQFPDYPKHGINKKENSQKDHQKTLCCRMMGAKANKMNRSKRNLLLERGLKPSHFLVHLGDLKKSIDTRKFDTQRRTSRPLLEDSDDEQVHCARRRSSQGQHKKRKASAFEDTPLQKSLTKRPRPSRDVEMFGQYIATTQDAGTIRCSRQSPEISPKSLYSSINVESIGDESNPIGEWSMDWSL